MILLALLLLIVISISTVVLYTLLYGISPAPSSPVAKKLILKAIPQDTPGKIFELGSGWGTLAFPIARRCRQNKVIAYEISPLPYLTSLWLLKLLPLPNLKVYRKNFMKEPLGEASVIVCYLYPKAMELLKTKFDQELIPGTLIISNTFAIPGWKPIQTLETNDLYKTKIYLYRF